MSALQFKDLGNGYAVLELPVVDANHRFMLVHSPAIIKNDGTLLHRMIIASVVWEQVVGLEVKLKHAITQLERDKDQYERTQSKRFTELPCRNC